MKRYIVLMMICLLSLSSSMAMGASEAMNQCLDLLGAPQAPADLQQQLTASLSMLLKGPNAATELSMLLRMDHEDKGSLLQSFRQCEASSREPVLVAILRSAKLRNGISDTCMHELSLCTRKCQAVDLLDLIDKDWGTSTRLQDLVMCFADSQPDRVDDIAVKWARKELGPYWQRNLDEYHESSDYSNSIQSIDFLARLNTDKAIKELVRCVEQWNDVAEAVEYTTPHAIEVLARHNRPDVNLAIWHVAQNPAQEDSRRLEAISVLVDRISSQEAYELVEYLNSMENDNDMPGALLRERLLKVARTGRTTPSVTQPASTQPAGK